jgi:CHASE2 domain-containing sensor protein
MFGQLKKLAWQWRGVILTVSNVTVLITLVRLFGWFQPLAWSSLDLLFKIRPPEPPDDRIIIISLEETDIQKYQQWPVSDRLLAKLITKIKTQQPRVIGLDLHRDLPVPPGYGELVTVFQTTPNLIGIQKVSGDRFYPTIAPPPILAQLGQVSASDLVLDRDGVLRRAILFPRTEEHLALPTFGLAVALEYLKKEGIHPTPSATANIYGAVDGVVFEAFIVKELVPQLWKDARRNLL